MTPLLAAQLIRGKHDQAHDDDVGHDDDGEWVAPRIDTLEHHSEAYETDAGRNKRRDAKKTPRRIGPVRERLHPNSSSNLRWILLTFVYHFFIENLLALIYFTKL